MSTVLTEAALLAFYSTAEAVSIVLFGVGARWAGYLDGTINGRLSRFCMRLLNPALCLSLYSFFSASKLARWWPVLIVATLHIALGALLGRLAGALLLLTPPHRQILVMSVGFANCGAIPFVLVVPLFQQWSRTKDDPEALGDAYSVIGLYLLVWILLFFSVGRGIVYTIKPNAGSAQAQQLVPDRAANAYAHSDVARGSSSRDSLPISDPPHAPPGAKGSRGCLWCLRRAADGVWGLADRNLVCILIALGIGCIGPLKAELEEGGLRWMGSVWDQLGKTNVVLSTMLLGSALQPDARVAIRALCAWVGRDTRSGRRSNPVSGKRGPSLRAAGAAAELGQCKVGSGAATGSEAPGVRLSSAALEPHLSAGLPVARSPPELPPDELQSDGSTVSSPPVGQQRLRIALATILLKLVVMPAICIPLQELAASSGVLEDEPVLLVVLHMMSGLPSSLSLVVLLLSTGQQAVAEQVGALYLPQYLVAVLSIALVTTIAITFQSA